MRDTLQMLRRVFRILHHQTFGELEFHVPRRTFERVGTVPDVLQEIMTQELDAKRR